MKLTESQILGIVANELSNANITTSSPTMLRQPLSYYLGLPNGTEVEGRSQLTSTDVADAIEWIMPQIMKSFTQNNEVVTFDPLNKEDELQAEIESEYVYDVIMKQNDGFVLIHQMVKDALIQRNGLLKVYYEGAKDTKIYSYTGIDHDGLQAVVQSKNAELLSYTVDELTGLFNIEVAVVNPIGFVRIDSVSPENFRVNSQHDSICLDSARFTAHIVNKSLSDLRKEGYKQADIDNLASSDLIRSSYRFNFQNEPTLIPSTTGDDESQKLVEICECYLELDMKGKGMSELYKVTVAGAQPPVKVLRQEPLDNSPWVSTTPILMSHKFQGLSIYDRLKQIQDNKTALLRNIMDNMYLQNNQRNVVLEGQVNLEDLMVSRPGGLIRVKRIDAIQPLQTPQIGDTGFVMMKYLDEVKAGRVGVSADGGASPQNIGDRVGSQGVDRLMNAKEELVGLIIRVICETGIKPLCMKVRDLVTMHTDTIQDFQFKGQWVKVDPSQWPTRSKCTVRVGTGSGDVAARTAAITKVMEIQSMIQQVPGQALVNPIKAYAALDEFCKLSGLHSANRYFLDPNSPEGQQAAQQAGQQQQQSQQKDEQIQIAQYKLQAELARSATITAEADAKSVEYNGKTELAKHLREMDKLTSQTTISRLQAELDSVKTQLDAKQSKDKLEFDYRKLIIESGLALTKIEADVNNFALDKEFEANEDVMEDEDDDTGE